MIRNLTSQRPAVRQALVDEANALNRKSALIQAVCNFHGNVSRWAGALRNETAIEVWTESPTDKQRLAPGKEPVSLEGWRTRARDDLAALGAEGAEALSLVSGTMDLTDALAGIMTSGPNVLAALQSSYDANLDRDGNLVQKPLTTAERTALATVLEAELE